MGVDWDRNQSHWEHDVWVTWCLHWQTLIWQVLYLKYAATHRCAVKGTDRIRKSVREWKSDTSDLILVQAIVNTYDTTKIPEWRTAIIQVSHLLGVCLLLHIVSSIHLIVYCYMLKPVCLLWLYYHQRWTNREHNYIYMPTMVELSLWLNETPVSKINGGAPKRMLHHLGPCK